VAPPNGLTDRIVARGSLPFRTRQIPGTEALPLFGVRFARWPVTARAVLAPSQSGQGHRIPATACTTARARSGSLRRIVVRGSPFPDRAVARVAGIRPQPGDRYQENKETSSPCAVRHWRPGPASGRSPMRSVRKRRPQCALRLWRSNPASGRSPTRSVRKRNAAYLQGSPAPCPPPSTGRLPIGLPLIAAL
jgi:hypothetical protein